MEWSFKHGFLESVHGFLEITSCNCSQPDQIHIEPLYTSNCHGSRWAGNCFQENVCLSDSQSSSNWFQRLIFGFDQKNINSKLHPAPHEVLILLVLLVSWMEDPPEVQSEYDVLEFFAGVWTHSPTFGKSWHEISCLRYWLWEFTSWAIWKKKCYGSQLFSRSSLGHQINTPIFFQSLHINICHMLFFVGACEPGHWITWSSRTHGEWICGIST